MADEFALFWMASFAFFRRLFVQLRTNNQCHVFLNAIRRGLKGRPNKLLAERFCSKLFSVKSYAQMRECFEGIKAFSLHVYKPFSFKFCIQCGLESANFGCWVVCAINCHTKLLGFPLKFKPKQFQFSCISWAQRRWRLEDSDSTILVSLIFDSFKSFETSEYVYFILNKHIGLKRKKCLNFSSLTFAGTARFSDN